MKVGIDILEIDRIKPDTKFLEKILTENEMQYVNTFEDIRERVAGIFCAKEAIFKALDIQTLNHQEIEICHKENGRPFVQFYGLTALYFHNNFKSIDISISHSHTIATAIALAEDKKGIVQL